MTASPTPLRGDSVNLSKDQTVRMVRTWITERTPAAVVRFLEGEGRLLAANPSDEISMGVAIRKLRRQTGLTFSPEEMLKVRSLVLAGLDGADIVGIRPGRNFPDEHKAWIDRITEIYADRVARGRRPAYVGRCLLNHDLHDAFPELLSGQRQLTVVSCRNLGPILKADYKLENVVLHQIPSQYVMRNVDDEFEARLHDVPIWPDFYRKLEASIEVREKGELFLIGAGLFGKYLCVHIRDLGGIALDMGSSLDRMANKTTRGPNRPQIRPFPETPRLV